MLGRVLQHIRVAASHEIIFFMRKVPHEEKFHFTDRGLDVVGICPFQPQCMQVVETANKIPMLVV